MSKKSASKAEKVYWQRVRDIGCMICHSDSDIHHCGTYMGGGRDNMKVIPLCPAHHRNGGYAVAIHAGKKEWERLYGTEEHFLRQVELLLKG